MTQVAALDARYRACVAALKPRNQEHLLRWWDQLTPPQRDVLLADIESIPWQTLDRLIPTHVLRTPQRVIPSALRPADVWLWRPALGQEALYREAARAGQELIRSGKVAALTVAGGQGSRLGRNGPKGTLVVTPVGDRTLFQLFAETIQAVRRRYRTAIPWYVMTSPANHGPTVDYFRSQRFFGLPRGDVMLFRQGTLPVFDRKGGVLMEARHRLALAPDGHGGALKALVQSGALHDMRARGVEIISYFQVDNPLAKPFDPLFVGLHATMGSEMSTKVTPKSDDLERVGNVCICDGKVMVIEYSDFPDKLAHARNADGSRRFDHGNLAIHLLNVGFVSRIVGGTLELPYRRAEKVVPYLDENGSWVEPTRPNAIKLERLIFDALPLADHPLVLEVDRAEEFAPVKNATGVDSLESAKRAQCARACRWLESAGIQVPRTADGSPDVTVAIAPSFALNAEDVQAKADRVPALKPGDAFYLK